MKIAVVGTGYVGLSMAILLAQNNCVVTLDIVEDRVNALNSKKSPINEPDIEFFLNNKQLNLKATLDKGAAYANADFVIIATPTDYDPRTNYFNTNTVESVIEDVLKINSNAIIVVKSTIPIGFIDGVREKYSYKNIFFSPEFLREGYSLYDNQYPSRIVIGENNENARQFAELLKGAALKKDVPIIYTGPTEAEAIKLFANTYLAMRVAYFNELDSYAEAHELNTHEIIEAVCLDPRIGRKYNNPSFGYGGYCLPKDTKQLLASYAKIPQTLMQAIVSANDVRKDFIANKILEKRPKTIGIYRLAMKSGSDNFRSSSILGVIERLEKTGVKIFVYEPTVLEGEFQSYLFINNLKDFKSKSELIIANRKTDELNDVLHKLYTRDIYGCDN